MEGGMKSVRGVKERWEVQRERWMEDNIERGDGWKKG